MSSPLSEEESIPQRILSLEKNFNSVLNLVDTLKKQNELLQRQNEALSLNLAELRLQYSTRFSIAEKEISILQNSILEMKLSFTAKLETLETRVITQENTLQAEINFRNGMDLIYGNFDLEIDKNRGLDLVRQAKDAGHQMATFQYVMCLLEGIGIEESVANNEIAAACAKRMADQGSSDLQVLFGECLFWGWGCPSDQVEAFRYFKMASEQGNVLGHTWVGCYYNHEHGGVSKDDDKALQMYEKGAKVGNPGAQYASGCTIERCPVTNKDLKKASSYYREAASGFALKGFYEYGRCCLEGIGVTKDLSKALRYFAAGATLRTHSHHGNGQFNVQIGEKAGKRAGEGGWRTLCETGFQSTLQKLINHQE